MSKAPGRPGSNANGTCALVHFTQAPRTWLGSTSICAKGSTKSLRPPSSPSLNGEQASILNPLALAVRLGTAKQCQALVVQDASIIRKFRNLSDSPTENNSFPARPGTLLDETQPWCMLCFHLFHALIASRKGPRAWTPA